jgi:hypothetical protein
MQNPVDKLWKLLIEHDHRFEGAKCSPFDGELLSEASSKTLRGLVDGGVLGTETSRPMISDRRSMVACRNRSEAD